MNLDIILNSDCVELLRSMPDNCIDLVVTSPPYAEQRSGTYGGIKSELYPDWISNICKEIYRVLKPTGSFVLNIKEHVSGGARDTYVLKSLLQLSEIFIWNDTFIWNKLNPYPTGNKKRLKDGFEYCYLFTKSQDYKFYPDNVLVRSDSVWLDSEKQRKNKGAHFVSNKSGMNMSSRFFSDLVRPSNVISLPVDSSNHEHPATFPIGLPAFFIKLLTDESDVVFDPFCGSGTTCVAAKISKRHYVGCDVMSEYVKLSMDRIERTAISFDGKIIVKRDSDFKPKALFDM